MRADDCVDVQVDAYNRHDLAAFLACYAPDAKVLAADGTVLLDGTDAIGRQYGGWFRDLPELAVEVRGRLRAGGWVVDEEHVRLGEGNEMSGLVAYRVEDGLIRSVVMLTDGS